MPYGAFVKLEPGIEGLVHISEMSWVKRIADPKELVQIGDKVEVQVLNINHDKKEISLGMKQCQANPWGEVAKKYPTGTIITGTVRNLTNYALHRDRGGDRRPAPRLGHELRPQGVEPLGDGPEGSEAHLRRALGRPGAQRVLGLKQMGNDPWESDIPDRFKPGQKTGGKVTKLTNFGVFVELEPGLEGLLHISELGRQDREPRGGGEGRRRGGREGAPRGCQGPQDRPSMRNVDDPTVPDDIPDMPIEGIEAEKAMEEKARASKEGAVDKTKPCGGTGTAGPLFQLPGEGEEE